MNFRECELGFSYQANEVLVFFGKKTADLEKIKSKYPQIDFARVKQTHSDKIIEASHELTEADSHWTSKARTGLLIATADCLPVMIHNKKTNAIAAVHAGWRGVENQITLKTLKKIASEKTELSDIHIWIGPHILQKSFEVDQTVLDLLLKSNLNTDTSTCYYFRNDKYFINLIEIVKSQISSVFGKLPTIYVLEKDTKSENSLHSFRRDKAESGRNLSFICRLN